MGVFVVVNGRSHMVEKAFLRFLNHFSRFDPNINIWSIILTQWKQICHGKGGSARFFATQDLVGIVQADVVTVTSSCAGTKSEASGLYSNPLLSETCGDMHQFFRIRSPSFL